MSDLISRSALIEKLKIPAEHEYHKYRKDAFAECLDYVRDLPTIEAVPVVHGEWIKEMGAFFPRYICSACREKYGAEWYRHCPSCGAKMKGGAE